MKFPIVKSAWVWLKSFVKPQVVKTNIITAGDVTVESKTVVKKPYPLVMRYRPYDLEYLFVGYERSTDGSDKLLYRFYDPETKQEFLVSEALARLLFYSVPREHS